MRTIRDIYTHLTSKSFYTYPESSSVLISTTSIEPSVVENVGRHSRNLSQRFGESSSRSRSKSASPMRFLYHSDNPGEINIKNQDQNTGYSANFGYERIIIKGDNDYQRWLQDYAKKDLFTDWVESVFGRSVGR